MIQSLTPDRKWAFPALLLLIFAWAVFARFGDLNADAAFHLSKSAGVIFDPFSHSGNARSYILFGDLHPDDWNTYVYSPVFVLLQIAWFSVFGITVSSMHAYGATWSILAIGLSWFCFRNYGRLAGLLALTFFGSHYIFAQLGRLALLENAGIFFTLLAFLALSRTLNSRRAFFCGAAAFLIFVIKGTIFYAVPAIGCGVVAALGKQWLETKNLKQQLIVFAWYLGGTLAIFLPWLLLFRIENQAEISRLGGVWWISAKPESLSASLNYLINDQLFQKIDRHDLISIVAVAMGGVTLYHLLVNWRKVNPLAVAMMTYLILGGIFVGLLAYKPTRFCAPLIPALLGLGTLGLVEFYRNGRISHSFHNWFAADISALVTLTLILRMKVFLYDWGSKALQTCEFGLLPGQWDSLLSCFVVALLLWGLIRIFLFLFIRETFEIPHSIKSAIVILFVAHFLYGNISAHYRWWNDRHHSIVDASRKLQGKPHMIIGGLSVHALVMETTHRAVRIQHDGWHNGLGHKLFTDLGLTHLLLTDYNGHRLSYFTRWPKQMAKVKRVDSFKMGGQAYHLYELPKRWRKKWLESPNNHGY